MKNKYYPPLITACTANISPNEKEYCFTCGMVNLNKIYKFKQDKFLQKPVSYEKLINIID